MLDDASSNAQCTDIPESHFAIALPQKNLENITPTSMILQRHNQPNQMIPNTFVLPFCFTTILEPMSRICCQVRMLVYKSLFRRGFWTDFSNTWSQPYLLSSLAVVVEQVFCFELEVAEEDLCYHVNSA